MTPYRWFKKFFRDGQYWDDLVFFRSVSLFHGLRTRDLGHVMQALQKRSYRAGEVLFTEGEVGKAVFIVNTGKVRLIHQTSNGPRTLAEVTAGGFFGEMALLENKPRAAGAMMVEDGDIYLLYTATLEALIQMYPTIGACLMKNLSIMLSSLLRKSNLELDGRY